MESKEEDFSSLSITDKLQHKLWKARVSACEDLTKLFKTTIEDSDFDNYEPLLKKMTVEPNAIAQEAGLSAVMEYVSNAPNAISTRDTIIPALVEKCLGAIKAGTKQKATDIVLLYAEVDTPDPVVELVLPGTNAKQPKLVTQTVFVLKELVRQFGIKKVNPKPIIKILPRLFGHTDKNVRAETFALTVELYRWIGQPLMASLSTLKPVQIKDLEEAFSKLPSEKPSPERLIRSEQAIQEVEQAQNDVEVDDTLAENEMEIDEVDAFDLADPVDITAKLPANFYELLQSKKWQERREALDALLDQTKTPKIMDRDYSELIGALAKRINDSNILLVGATATCIEHIATGLRTDFGKYKSIIAPVIIEKLKERKPAILEQLANGLNAVFASVPMSELIEDVTVASKHKNPQVRSECFKLLARRLKEVKEMPGKTEIKSFAELFKNLLDDADANAREAGAEGLGTLMKLVGEKPMLVFTDGLNDIQMGKIREAYEKATVKVKASKKSQPPPAAVKSVPPKAVKKAAPPARLASKPTPEPMSIDEAPDAATNSVNSMIPPKRKPPSRLAGASSMKKPALLSSKPKASAPSSAAATGPKKSAKLPPPSGPEEIKYKYSQEDAEVRAAEFIPEAILTDLKHAQWKIRLAAMESLRQHLEQMDGSAIEPEIVIRSFSKKPGWKEMNFQVMSNVISSIQDLVVKCPNFNKACGVLCIPVLVDKLSDAKLKKLSGECLATIAEKFSLQFVFSQAYPLLKKAKSPKVLSDCLLWIYATLMDFGIHGLQIRDLIDLVKFGLTNINATVRTHSVTLLGALRQFVGPEVKSFVEDVSPALLATIEQEFERVSKLDPPQPTKAPKGSSGGNGGVEVSDGNDANADAIESLFPRVDISGPLNKTVAQCGDANWKIRKEGLDNVIQIIAGANNRIKPNLGAEFPGVLKQRLNDSNKNLQIMAVEIAGSLAVAMGKPFEKYIKTFTGPVIAVLSDNKANVRAAGVKALENFRNTCSMELMAPIFGTSLANEAPTLRKELLSWISSSIKKEADVAKYDFTGMVLPLFSCLQDRNGDVRKAAQACLPEIVAIVGYDNVIGKTSELKAAQRQTVLPLIEAARESATIITAPSSVTPTSSVSRKRPESMYATDDHGRSPAAAAPSRIKAPLKKKIGGIPAPRSQATSHASATSIEDAATPILTSDPRAKQMRAKKEIRWQFDSPRSDVIDSLKATFDTNMSPELTSLLFSTSQHAERDRLNGLNFLNDCLTSPDTCASKYRIDYEEMKRRFVANADLILKYLTIRFFDTNTSMLIKCLDLTQNLVTVMEEESYHLSEYEAVSFLPYLINKVGDPKEVMRTRVRGILSSMSLIYPPNKLFNYLLDSAANSKNAKVRSECLEEVGSLIQKNGISVMLPNKSLPIIAAHIGDRDSGVRNAALNAVAQAYILIGHPVMKYVSRLGDKEKSMLEERLKRTTPSASVLEAEERERAKQKENEMEIDELPSLNNLPRLGGRSQITKPRSTANLQRAIQHPQAMSEPEPMEDITDDHGQRIIEPHANRINPDIRQIRPVSFGSQHQQHQPHSSFVSNPTEILDYLISQINSSNQHESIDALKGIDKLLRQNVKSALPDIGRIINGITLQIKMASSATDPRQGLTPRLCKHIVNVLVLVFSRPVLVSAIPVEGLQHLLEQLARRLLDQKTNGSETGPQLSKALNVAMVKILENSERNQTFSALLAILSSGSERLLDNTITIAQEAKYIELIMKCLWKLAKTIQESLKLSILNPDALLFDINRFFLTTPPTTWKQRAANKVPLGEMPLRTVKTLLLELVNGLRDSIFRHLTMIDNPQDSHVYPYLLHMLDACRKKDQEDNPHYQQQQQQISSVTPQQLEENAPNHLLSHSHHSSQSRPTSTSLHKSDTVARSLSAVSYPSNDVEQNYVDNPTLSSPNASIQSPHLSSPVLNNIALNSVHPMQIDQPTVNEYVQQGLTDYDLNVKLTRIFHKIGNRDYTKQGIIELYEFQKSYPHASGKVNNYLSQTGSYFQSYIRRGLSNLEAEDNELQAQSQGQSTMASISPTPTSTIGKELPSFSSSINTTERQQERSIFESQQARNDISRASVHAADNAAEIKLRFLKLQQKFGYKSNVRP